MLRAFLRKHKMDEQDAHKAQINFLQGLLAFKKTETDTALVCLEKSLIEFTKQDNALYQAKALLVLGWISEAIGYWDQSKIHYYKVIELVNEQNPRELGLAYLGIARCKYYLMEANDAELKKGVSLLQSMRIVEYSLYADYTACALADTNEQTPMRLIDIAERYINEGLNINAASVYKSLASYYKHNREYDSAHHYLDKALWLSESSFQTSSFVPSLNQLMGSVYFDQKDYENAKSYLHKSLALYNDYKQTELSYYAYDILYRIDTVLGDYKSAFEHLSLSNYHRRAVQNKSDKQLAKMMETSLEVAVLKQEIKTLQAITKNNLLLFIIGFIILSAIIYIISSWVIKKNKNKYKKIAKEEKEKYELSKNLIDRLRELRVLRGLKAELQSDSLSENAMCLINEGFENSYAETIKKTKSLFPTLTDSEASYVVMLIMKLENDEIAEIRRVSKETVRKTKQRIRKKLGLETGYDLQQYFSAFIHSP